MPRHCSFPSHCGLERFCRRTLADVSSTFCACSVAGLPPDSDPVAGRLAGGTIEFPALWLGAYNPMRLSCWRTELTPGWARLSPLYRPVDSSHCPWPYLRRDALRELQKTYWQHNVRTGLEVDQTGILPATVKTEAAAQFLSVSPVTQCIRPQTVMHQIYQSRSLLQDTWFPQRRCGEFKSSGKPCRLTNSCWYFGRP
jgi:hypothetical protein